VLDVNGNTVKLASLLNHESCTDDEAIVLTCPFVPVYANPCARLGNDNVPIEACVLDEYPNEARVVDVLENVFRAVNTLDVYVLGIVVDAAMYELIELLSEVESIVSAPPTLDSPEPSSELND
jgi:hypothetical protein